ncbi:MAG TPA: protein translocase SEC61 complex subunit gamma [Thermoplasmata archaeon]|nr:protein translocase SEC61 complex subunit gamma [Thermoplasmata archaeon]
MVDVIDYAWSKQRKLEDSVRRWRKGGWIGKWGEIIKMARRPSRDEYVKTTQITGVGILLLGALGFGIYLLVDYVTHVVRGGP